MERIIIVHLRRPGKDDLRSDPFWEFGSFGVTGCHHNNLLHPKNSPGLIGIRLAFAQSGKLGTRLVYLTPPINRVVVYRRRSEVLWSPAEMPFRYEKAPLLISNGGKSDFARLKEALSSGRRTTWVGQFASDFRTRKKALGARAARQLVTVYEHCRKCAPRTHIADNYVDCPTRSQHSRLRQQDRVEIYEERREEAGEVMKNKWSCIRTKRKLH